MRIARSLIDEVVAHAHQEAPDECCGMIAGRDGQATRVLRAENAAHSRLRYELDPREQLRLMEDLDAAGEELAGIYHSHTGSAPYPSQTDINLAFYPESLYVIAGVAADEPEVRAYRILDGRVEEVELEVI